MPTDTMQPTEQRKAEAKQLLADLLTLYRDLSERDQDDVRFTLLEMTRG